MKRYEKLGIDLNTVEGIERIIDMCCNDIDDKFGGIECKYSNSNKPCSHCMAERLFEDVPTKKVQRIATYSDASKAWNDYENCNFAMPYSNWLAQEIEIEDEGR